MSEFDTGAREYSRPFDVRSMKQPSIEITLETTEPERQALAERFDLLDLSSFRAQLRIDSDDDHTFVHVSGQFSADLKQSCVVTLEPVQSHIEGTVDRDFIQPSDVEAATDAVEFDPDAPDPPDPLIDGLIDLGDVVAEELGLEIEPFPRAPGVETGDYIEDDGSGDDNEASNPFAVLKEIQQK